MAKFKEATKPFRDLPGEILDSFKIPDLNKEFDRSVTLAEEERKTRSEIEKVSIEETFDENGQPQIAAVPITGEQNKVFNSSKFYT